MSGGGRILELYFASRKKHALPSEFQTSPVTAGRSPQQTANWTNILPGALANSLWGNDDVWVDRAYARRGTGGTRGREGQRRQSDPIIIPCHRVIGSNGRMVGYGPGIDLKGKLLELEGSTHPSFAWNKPVVDSTVITIRNRESSF